MQSIIARWTNPPHDKDGNPYTEVDHDSYVVAVDGDVLGDDDPSHQMLLLSSDRRETDRLSGRESSSCHVGVTARRPAVGNRWRGNFPAE